MFFFINWNENQSTYKLTNNSKFNLKLNVWEQTSTSDVSWQFDTKIKVWVNRTTTLFLFFCSYFLLSSIQFIPKHNRFATRMKALNPIQSNPIKWNKIINKCKTNKNYSSLGYSLILKTATGLIYMGEKKESRVN